MPSDAPTPPDPQDKGAPKSRSYGKKVLVWTACGLGVYWVTAHDPEHRYPIRVEYELAKACIDGSGGLLSRDSYLAKQERCLCTLEATMRKIPYKEYTESSDAFASTFRKIAPTCTNKGRS